MAKLNVTTEHLIESIVKHNFGVTSITCSELRAWCDLAGYNYNTIYNRLKPYKAGRGQFNFDKAQVVQELETVYEAPTTVTEVQTIHREYQDLVPPIDDNYVPFGNFKDVNSVIKSGTFYPLFITGLSGNGKTLSVEQACAKNNRDLIRVNITIETDQDDLVGGFRLKDGETVWHDGPVIEAMKRGAILLLDEIDLASNKILCLQSILEGKGYFIKKTNQWVQPAPGFNIIATANTKGRSDESGRFIGTNVLNEAFLERFAVTFEQAYPTPGIEAKILTRVFATLGNQVSDKLVSNLVDWADIIRRTYRDGGIEDVISTRRLVNIAKAITIWGDTNKAIELCTNRFDTDTKRVFVELFQKVSGDESEGYNENELNNRTDF